MLVFYIFFRYLFSLYKNLITSRLLQLHENNHMSFTYRAVATKIAIISLLLSFLTAHTAIGQTPEQPTSAEIYNKMEKFGVLANVLFVAAHPDDENTRMISYLSNDLQANTRYLSLTRGDGGQNLIGTEIKELLGVIRTQELLAARRIDGGSQRFSRANDFGYSKNAEETIKIWDDKKVLSDVVWAIRSFRPDVIINRFDHKSSGKTHGHHTASAMLAYQAWDLTGDKTAFPEQLKYVDPWQPTRQFFNTSWWFYGSREKFAEADKSSLMSVDVGTYYPTLGLSNNEIAAYSRSMHVCQGMGNTPKRGGQIEYLDLINGEMPAEKKNIFDGLDITWTRVKGGAAIKGEVKALLDSYDFRNPAASLKQLVEIRKLVKAIDDQFWKPQKLEELDAIIEACAGIFVETKSDDHTVTAGAMVDFSTEVVKRLESPTKLTGISIAGGYLDTILNAQLPLNEVQLYTHEIRVREDAKATSPYYLQQKGSLGMYKVDDQQMIGLPETPRHFIASYTFDIYGESITLVKDVIYKYTDPERGEVYRPLEVVKELYVTLPEKVYIFSNGETKDISVDVKAMAANQRGEISIPVSEGWTANPKSIAFDIKTAGQEQRFTFKVTAPKNQVTTTLSPMIKSATGIYKTSLIPIDYDHIPYQLVEMPAEAEFVNLDIKISDKKIAYIPGAGDEVATNLKQIGFDVEEIPVNDITKDRLSTYATVIMGIRAYNKWEALRIKQNVLMEYVKGGGTLVVQYNTNRRLKVDNIGPYPLSLSRARVSVEGAPVKMLANTHPILNTPNKITDADFDDWVQERGLYFADNWDDKYTPILESNDPEDEPRAGGMLHATYGEGNFVYTGYSWFRQLPAGVPGAYRIFANIISLGH